MPGKGIDIAILAAFELFNADEVTIAKLELTGAYYGVYLGGGSDSDNVTLEDLVVHDHNQDGVYIASSNEWAVIRGGEYYGNASGIYFLNNSNQLVEEVTAYSNTIGIETVNADSTTLIRNNEVHDNVQLGISAWAATVEGNTVYDHTGSSDRGIGGSGWIHGNIVYNNYVGIDVGGNALIEGNRVYANLGIGIDVADHLAHAHAAMTAEDHIGGQDAKSMKKAMK